MVLLVSEQRERNFMAHPTLGQFIAGKLPGSVLTEWDMAPESFDFEVKHGEKTLSDKSIKSWVEEFFDSIKSKHSVDRYLDGTVALGRVDYTLCITNSKRPCVIRGTLKLE